MLNIGEVRTGKKIVLDNEPYAVVWNQFSKTARQGGCMKTKLKNLLTGKVMEKTFQGNDKVDEADLVFKKAQFLYSSGENYDFMDQESFETVSLNKEVLGFFTNFLKEGIEVDLQYFNGNAINIQMKPKMAFSITESEPGIKGDTASGGTKNAKIETGLEIKVPFFIEVGENVIISTETGEYVEREKK